MIAISYSATLKSKKELMQQSNSKLNKKIKLMPSLMWIEECINSIQFNKKFQQEILNQKLQNEKLSNTDKNIIEDFIKQYDDDLEQLFLLSSDYQIALKIISYSFHPETEYSKKEQIITQKLTLCVINDLLDILYCDHVFKSIFIDNSDVNKIVKNQFKFQENMIEELNKLKYEHEKHK
jgi:hypothetical protein